MKVERLSRLFHSSGDAQLASSSRQYDQRQQSVMRQLKVLRRLRLGTTNNENAH